MDCNKRLVCFGFGKNKWRQESNDVIPCCDRENAFVTQCSDNLGIGNKRRYANHHSFSA